MALLELQGLSIGYKGRSVQRDLNLNAERGELVCLLGRNGVGKSTLLRTVGCIQPALGGEVLVDGVHMSDLTVGQRALYLSMVLTDVVRVENLTVRELVAMGRSPYTNWLGGLREKDMEVVDRVIGEVNLCDKTSAMVSELSDGERQRAVVARALAQDTPVVLLDEPTSHLDLPNRVEVMLLLKRLAERTGKLFVVSMHELDIAYEMADRIWLMTRDGVKIGTGKELYEKGLIEREFASEVVQFDVVDGRLRFRCEESKKRE